MSSLGNFTVTEFEKSQKDFESWKYNPELFGDYVVKYVGNGKWAQVAEIIRIEDYKKNAALIVSSQELLKTLRIATDQLERVMTGERFDSNVIDDLLARDLIKQIEAA